jgi:hypothetical protein
MTASNGGVTPVTRATLLRFLPLEHSMRFPGIESVLEEVGSISVDRSDGCCHERYRDI